MRLLITLVAMAIAPALAWVGGWEFVRGGTAFWVSVAALATGGYVQVAFV